MKKKSLNNINLGQQLLLKSFFDEFNFKNNLLLKKGFYRKSFLYLTNTYVFIYLISSFMAHTLLEYNMPIK